MPVRYGIVCQRCRKLHFIFGDQNSTRVHFDRQRGEFKVTCIPPCPNTIYFRREMLMAYVVPDDALPRGYAELEYCRPVTKSE